MILSGRPKSLRDNSARLVRRMPPFIDQCRSTRGAKCFDAVLPRLWPIGMDVYRARAPLFAPDEALSLAAEASRMTLSRLRGRLSVMQGSLALRWPMFLEWDGAHCERPWMAAPGAYGPLAPQFDPTEAGTASLPKGEISLGGASNWITRHISL